MTNKAISPDATRITAEISDYIQSEIDGGLLDVDRDGLTTPLGGGLMVIRSFLGTTFTGSALTNKAISPDSIYANDAQPWEAAAANIDGLVLGGSMMHNFLTRLCQRVRNIFLSSAYAIPKQ